MQKRKEDRLVVVNEEGKVCELWNVEITESIQDKGRTLKLFIKNKNEPNDPCIVCMKKEIIDAGMCAECFNDAIKFFKKTKEIENRLKKNFEKIIENRIKSEYKKHKDLDWAKIASVKIWNTIKEINE